MNKKSSQKGSALVYILIAIALLAALTATLMDSNTQQTTSQNTFNTVTDLNSQVNFVRSTIQECVLTYPAGDSTLLTATNIPYPVNPSSTYFTAAPCSCVGASNAVSLLRCPGNPGTGNNHTVIFGGASGKFMPPAPGLFNAWTYYNGPDGVFFFTSTNKTDSYLSTALSKLDDQYSECEADIINNSASGSALNITSAGVSGPNCPANSVCFRVWMIAQTSNIYPGDSDTDETGCP